jgi:hypothetical protein
MPFFSGYAIASGRQVKSMRASLEIGFVMGLTLGSTIMVIGALAITVISLLESEVTEVYNVVVVIVALAIGSYTAIAACIGAFLATHWNTRSRSKQEFG